MFLIQYPKHTASPHYAEHSTCRCSSHIALTQNAQTLGAPPASHKASMSDSESCCATKCPSTRSSRANTMSTLQQKYPRSPIHFTSTLHFQCRIQAACVGGGVHGPKSIVFSYIIGENCAIWRGKCACLPFPG